MHESESLRSLQQRVTLLDDKHAYTVSKLRFLEANTEEKINNFIALLNDYIRLFDNIPVYRIPDLSSEDLENIKNMEKEVVKKMIYICAEIDSCQSEEILTCKQEQHYPHPHKP